MAGLPAERMSSGSEYNVV